MLTKAHSAIELLQTPKRCNPSTQDRKKHDPVKFLLGYAKRAGYQIKKKKRHRWQIAPQPLPGDQTNQDRDRADADGNRPVFKRRILASKCVFEHKAILSRQLAIGSVRRTTGIPRWVC